MIRMEIVQHDQEQARYWRFVKWADSPESTLCIVLQEPKYYDLKLEDIIVKAIKFVQDNKIAGTKMDSILFVNALPIKDEFIKKSSSKKLTIHKLNKIFTKNKMEILSVLKQCRCDYICIGYGNQLTKISERSEKLTDRIKKFFENDLSINQKILYAKTGNKTPVYIGHHTFIEIS